MAIRFHDSQGGGIITLFSLTTWYGYGILCISLTLTTGLFNEAQASFR
jgi:hypothetical protein